MINYAVQELSISMVETGLHYLDILVVYNILEQSNIIINESSTSRPNLLRNGLMIQVQIHKQVSLLPTTTELIPCAIQYQSEGHWALQHQFLSGPSETTVFVTA